MIRTIVSPQTSISENDKPRWFGNPSRIRALSLSLFNIHPIFPRHSLSESITRSIAFYREFRWFSSVKREREREREKGEIRVKNYIPLASIELYRVTEINCPRLSCTGLTNVSGQRSSHKTKTTRGQRQKKKKNRKKKNDKRKNGKNEI